MGKPGELLRGPLAGEAALVGQSEEAREVTAEPRPEAGSREGRSARPATVCYFSNLVHDASCSAEEDPPDAGAEP